MADWTSTEKTLRAAVKERQEVGANARSRVWRKCHRKPRSGAQILVREGPIAVKKMAANHRKRLREREEQEAAAE